MKMIFSSILMLIALIFSCTTIDEDEQSNETDAYSNKTLHNDTVVELVNTNENGEVVLEKNNHYVGEFWPGKYITQVIANKVDEKEGIQCRIWAHSNIGFKIFFPTEIDDSTQVEYLIEDGYPIDPMLVNKNQFHYINLINESNQLFDYPEVKAMLEKGNKYHYKTSILDTNGNIIKELYYGEFGGVLRVHLNRFDDSGRRVYASYNDDYEYHYTYDSFGNEIHAKRINFRSKGKEGEIGYIEEWTKVYTRDNKLEKIIKTIDERLVSKEINTFKHGMLYSNTHYLYQEGSLKKSFETQYFYEDTMLVSQVEIDYENMDSIKRVITYEKR